MGSAEAWDGVTVASVFWADLAVIMGGGSFHPEPLETMGVKPGDGWSGM